MIKKSIPFILLLLITVLSDLFAQIPVVADRPGTGYSTSIVPVGYTIVEGGASLNEDLSDVGQLFMRLGLVYDLEFQINAGTVLIPSEGSARVGVQSFALKYSLGNFLDEQLSLSVFSRTDLPFFNSDYEYFLTRFMFLADYTVSEDIGININAGYGDFVGSIDSGSFNFNITPGIAISDELSAYFGYATQFNDNFTNDLLEGGMTYLLDPSFQLDGGFIYGDGSNLYLTFGVAKSF